MLMTNQLVGFGAGSAGGEGFSCIFTDSAVDPTDTSSPITFSSLDFGDAAAGRQIVVIANAGMDATQTISAVTIGGVAGTELVGHGNGSFNCDIYIASVPTDDDVTVIVTQSGGALENCGIGVFRATGLATTASSSNTSVADPFILTLTPPTGNSVIFGGGWSNSTTNFNFVGIDESYDEALDGAVIRQGGGFKVFTADDEVTVTMTADSPGGTRTATSVCVAEA
jgi:hypothetical protein